MKCRPIITPGAGMGARPGPLAAYRRPRDSLHLPTGAGRGHQHDAGSLEPGTDLHQQVHVPDGDREDRTRRSGGVLVLRRARQVLHQEGGGTARRHGQDRPGRGLGERSEPAGGLRPGGVPRQHLRPRTEGRRAITTTCWAIIAPPRATAVPGAPFIGAPSTARRCSSTGPRTRSGRSGRGFAPARRL